MEKIYGKKEFLNGVTMKNKGHTIYWVASMMVDHEPPATICTRRRNGLAIDLYMVDPAHILHFLNSKAFPKQVETVLERAPPIG